ncbi:MAG: ATP-binding protein [Polyangiaceae bacterium]
MMRVARALIVDDNLELAENLRDILRLVDGYDIDCAITASAEAARAHCRKVGHKLDLAFVDLHLPDADGLELVGDLRRRCPNCEVVLITGDATVESAAAAVAEGAFAFVLKPFSPKELMQTASNALARASLLRERESLRSELEVSERHHREVVEAIPAFVLALDAADRLVLWNRRLEEATGASRADMLGQAGRDLVGQGGDRLLPCKSGPSRMVRWQLAELAGAPAPITYALGTDVTEERAMLRRTLRAERLAAVGTLAAGLAHEVRNPLNSATLQLQVLRRRVEKGNAAPGSLLPVVDIVHDEIRRLERLVNDFLAFARPRPLEVAHTELDDLVKSVVVQLEPEVQQSGMRLEVQLAAECPVEVDAERLRQVLINLMRNALEAMAGEGVLAVRTRPADHEGFAHVEIEDTGPGIPDDAPIFDAFYTTKEAGTGLGLAIVHRIVDEHGGQVTVDSKPGLTVFRVRLPRAH